MNASSSRQRLRLAHQIVDKQLQGNYLGPSTASQSSRTKNVQSQISDLQKKLMDLERKMENIDVSSSNDQSENLQIFKKRLDSSLPKQRVKSSQKVIPPQISSRKSKRPDPLSEDEDSGDDKQIYAKIIQKKEKGQLLFQPKRNEQKKLMPSVPSKPEKRKIDKNEGNYSMKQSIKSMKSIKSGKSINSRKSIDLRKSNLSRKSNMSKKSNNSLSRDFSRGSKDKDMREIQIQNAKDSKKISNLQRQLKHYKRLCKKQQQKIEDFRVMEIEFRKLQANFAKSEQIRKQQKKIIESLKGKN